jgi:hypothetical protein
LISLFPQFLATSSPAEDGFETTNWGWQWSLWQRQVGEWIEYQFSRLEPDTSGWSLSPAALEILKILFWIGVGLFVGWLVWLLWQEFGPYILDWWKKQDPTPRKKAKINTQELSISFLLSQAQQFAKQGNYQEACRYIYLAMLQRLHEKAIAPQLLSRTDGEYLKLLRTSITPVQPYETLITTHEQLYFANTEMRAENYQQCQQAYQEIAQQPTKTSKQ